MYGKLAPPETTVSPLAVQRPLPPEPRVQGSVIHPNLDVQDMAEFRRAEDKQLNSYGWANRQAGLVRIPIDQAMAMTLQRGLPTTQPATQTAPAGG